MPTRYLEPGLNMLSGLLAEPVAGWAGLLSGNPDNVEKTRNALTYQPRTAEGRAGMNKLAGLLSDAKTVMVDQNPPVRMALEGYNALADRAGAVSPVLGAAVKTAPTALGLLAGPGTAPVRAAVKNVARDAYQNAGKAPALRGPLALQEGMIGFKPEPTDPLRYQADDVRASVREKMTPEAIQALSKYGSPDDAPLNEVMATIDGVPVEPSYRLPQDDALETARRNAVTMLGLPEDNTPMDRARALGFDMPVYHGTGKDFPAFDVSKGGKDSVGAGSREGALGVWLADEPEVANAFAHWAGNGRGTANVMPLLAKMENPWEVENYSEIKDLIDRHTDFVRKDLGVRMMQDKIDPEAARNELFQQGKDSIALRNTLTDSPDGNTRINQFVALRPENLRSRFAAFDPSRINENNLLGAADPRFLALTAGSGLLGLLGMQGE